MSENQDLEFTLVLDEAAPPSAPSTEAEEPTHNALPLGTRLGEFEIVGLVGEGGFGIVYLAQDHSLGRKVALKEYMPASLAARSHNASVVVRSKQYQETFDIGRRSFVNEARLLAQFDHPALVKVYRFWESNGTAYMVMPYFEGRTLRQELSERDVPPDEAWIKKTLAPVVDALELIHRENCFHRDIAPDNIMLLPDGRPVLLDFGAARRVIGDMTQALTVILKPGYAPIEQYAEMPGLKQGAWTDIYALAAVIYFMVARKLPPPSVGRMVQDSYEPLAKLAAGRYSEALLKGVDRCLSVRPEQRPQDMAAMRQALGFPTVTPAASVSHTKSLPHAPVQGSNKALVIGVISGFVLLLAGGGFAGYYFLNKLASGTSEEITRAANEVITQAEKTATPVKEEASKPHSFAEAIELLGRRADPALAPNLKTPSTVSVNGGQLTLSATMPTAGHLYLFLWDKSTDKFYRLFPNDFDGANSLAANSVFTVPKADLTVPWGFAANEPMGEWQLIALLSELPRDLSKSRLQADAGFVSASRADIDAAFAAGAGLEALFGSPVCATPDACKDRFGLASAKLQEVAEAVTPKQEKTAKNTPAKEEKTKEAPDKPSRKPAKGQGTDEQAEREYMKKLNKDLDKLLGK